MCNCGFLRAFLKVSLLSLNQFSTLLFGYRLCGCVVFGVFWKVCLQFLAYEDVMSKAFGRGLFRGWFVGVF